MHKYYNFFIYVSNEYKFINFSLLLFYTYIIYELTKIRIKQYCFDKKKDCCSFKLSYS